MMLKRILRRDNKGIGAVEFALVAPVLISFVIGISQMGKLFFANADMKNAMAHGARAASVWPVPEADVIEAAVNDRLERTGALAKADVDVVRDTDDDGNAYVDIEMTYQVPLEFIFFDIGPVTLEDTRRVFIQMNGSTPPEDTSTSSTTTGSTTSTTTGGTTSTTSSGDPSSTSTTSTSTTSSGDPSSTSATSAGGTTSSTSATSASSTGGTTSATSASSTSASTTSSTTSSSGNSNGNSSHGHGDCKKKC